MINTHTRTCSLKILKQPQKCVSELLHQYKHNTHFRTTYSTDNSGLIHKSKSLFWRVPFSTFPTYFSIIISDLNTSPFCRYYTCPNSHIKFTARYRFNPNVISLQNRRQDFTKNNCPTFSSFLLLNKWIILFWKYLGPNSWDFQSILKQLSNVQCILNMKMTPPWTIFLSQLFATEYLAADMWLITLLQSCEHLMIFGPMNDPSATWVIHG